MKRLVLGGLSVLLMSVAIAPSVKAESMAVNAADAGTSIARKTTPFNLVHLAQRGYFAPQGIPSYGTLLSAYRSGQISARDLVKSAVDANRIPPEVLNDRGYINAVESQLEGLDSNDRG
jgi:hypothetical protein